jgi:Type I phosphodiesterase / nucleotide pyrophosphatase
MSYRKRRVAIAGVCAAVVATGLIPLATARAQGQSPQVEIAKAGHVLLLSVDGLHQSDLATYVSTHPQSALASLVDRGTSYTHAQTPIPSDSFPGMVGQVTGGNPRTTGIYYDDSYNHDLLPAGTISCQGVAPGVEVNYTEALDKDPLSLDAGQGLLGLPGSILQMTGQPLALMNSALLPVDPRTCTPVYPHSYLKVNTVFEVLRAHGLRTAWSDKHAAYDILQGPSGNGIQDLFAPEVNSQADGLAAGTDWTKDNAKTQQYDGYKVQAVLNEIDGYDHSRSTQVGMPALLGMNFQSVSTAQKLPVSGGKPGGYLTDGTPGPVLVGALSFIDREVAAMVAELKARHEMDSTTIILSAKHGQSPVEPSALTRIPDGPIMDGLNAAWTAIHPDAGALVVQSTNDDAMIMWLSDRSQAAADFAKAYLLHHDGTGNDINGKPKPFTASGLTKVYAGKDSAGLFRVRVGDPRVPDLYAFAQHGVVFTGGTGKLAEHGGADPQDRNVPLVISGAAADAGTRSGRTVETTQIAPTILRLLGLSPSELQAVQIEGTQSLLLNR